MPDPVRLVNTTTGDEVTVPSDQVDRWTGYVPQTAAGHAASVTAEQRATNASGAANLEDTIREGMARGFSGGLTDVGTRLFGGEDAARQVANRAAQHPVLSTAANIAGGIAGAAGGVGPAGWASRAGTAVTESVGGLAGKAVGGAVEGTLFGAGQGVSDIALSDDPLTVEHMSSALSSNMLYGGGIGGGLGFLGGAADKALTKAQSALAEAGALRGAAESVPADLAGADAPTLKTARAAELDQLEEARVPQRAALADDITAHRATTADEKLLLVSKGSHVPGVRPLAARSAKADKALRGLADNPYAFAETPEKALPALQRQQAAYEELLAKEPELRASFAADESGARSAALDAMPGALERNKALQERIRDLSTPKSDLTSPRIQAIDTALDALAGGGRKASLPEQLLGHAVYSSVSGTMHALPIPGSSMVASLLGTKASQAVTDLVFGQLGSKAAESTAAAAKALEAFADGAKRAAPAAIPTATTALNAVRYAAQPAGSTRNGGAPIGERGPAPAKGSADELAQAYKARTDEVKSQTAFDSMGVPRMTDTARQAVADRLAPIRAASPTLADRLETIAARRIEYLSAIIPRQPDLMTLGAANTWRPSEMEMRSWARKVLAVEDPAGVEKRVADGRISPEDAEAYRAVYPERAAAFEQAMLAKVADRKEPLAYDQRLAMSIFSGRPIDPAMDPRILTILQGGFAEPGSAGGTQQPSPQPAFGSVKKSVEEPTPGQAREGGVRDT